MSEACPNATTVATTCAPWCDTVGGHHDLHVEDRKCWSQHVSVPHTLSAHSEPGETLRTVPRLTVGLVRPYGAQAAQVILHDEGADHEVYLTTSEARAVAAALSFALATDDLEEVSR